MHESMDQGLTLPVFLGYAAEVEEHIDNAFPFDLSHGSYLWMEEQVRKPLAFMADEVGDVMYYHQAMNQPDAWEFSQALVKEVNEHVNN